MAKIVRYDGNLKAFASEQLTNERTLFGQVAIANDLTSQITAQFLRGWGIVGPSDQPSLQDFNAAMYTNGQLLAYLHQMGVAEYNAAQEYFVGSLAQTGGVLYMSLSHANIGNTPSSSPASWKAYTADQATEVALGLVKIATQALTNAGADDVSAVTPKKLAVATQGQKHTAFSTTGTATAQALTPVPAITAYAATQRFNVTFNIASGANPTINVSGQGAKFLKQYDSTGAKIAAVFAAGHVSDIVYDGVDWVLLDTLPSISKQGVRGAASNLKASTSGGSASVLVTSDWLTVADSSGNCTTLPAVNLTINTAVAASSTVNGMATGAVAANTLYYKFVWYNPATGVMIATGDTSATTPTAPAAGFTQWARTGSFRTDGTANKYPLGFTQFGRSVQYKLGANLASYPSMIGGTSSGVAAIGVNGVVPATAGKITVTFGVTSGLVGNIYLGANASLTSSSAAALSNFNQTSNTVAVSTQVGILLESANIYWSSNSSVAFVLCVGWEDNL